MNRDTLERMLENLETLRDDLADVFDAGELTNFDYQRSDMRIVRLLHTVNDVLSRHEVKLFRSKQ